jgi:MFS family permease
VGDQFYLLPLSALLLLGGAAGDRFSRRRILILGIAVFGVSSALCAAAPNLVWLIVARGLQGTGAALLLPNSLAILGSSFSGEERGRAVGTWSAVGAIGGAIGPVLGGWVIDVFNWRGIFLINIPIAIGAAGLALLYVRDPIRSERTRIDLAGAILAAVSLGLLTFGLTVGSGRSGWSMEAIAALVAGVVLLAAFLWVERRRGDEAMMPLALFRSSVRRTQHPYRTALRCAGRVVRSRAVRVDSWWLSSTAAGARCCHSR